LGPERVNGVADAPFLRGADGVADAPFLRGADGVADAPPLPADLRFFR
jgi:hypothetical protein